MKKKIYILFLLLFVFNMIIAQTSKIKTVSINDETYFVYPEFQNKKNSNDLSIWRNSNIIKEYKLDSNTNIDGKWVQFYKNSTNKIAKKFTLKNRKINGVCTKYYPNGNKKRCGTLKNSLLDGKWTAWYENGNIKSIGEFKNDKYTYCGTISFTKYYEYKVGKWVYYYKNGNISASGYYKPSTINIETVCKNGANLHCGTFSKEWKAFNFKGKEINIKSLTKKKILKDKEVFLKRIYE